MKAYTERLKCNHININIGLETYVWKNTKKKQTNLWPRPFETIGFKNQDGFGQNQGKTSVDGDQQAKPSKMFKDWLKIDDDRQAKPTRMFEVWLKIDDDDDDDHSWEEPWSCWTNKNTNCSDGLTNQNGWSYILINQCISLWTEAPIVVININ